MKKILEVSKDFMKLQRQNSGSHFLTGTQLQKDNVTVHALGGCVLADTPDKRCHKRRSKTF